MIYITGDKHSDFIHLYALQEREKFFKAEDILIILGDSGFNYYVKEKENQENYRYQCEKGNLQKKRQFCRKIPCEVFCIHGNHEARAETVEGYKAVEWHGGVTYVQDEFPKLHFAKDGEVYDFEGQKYLVIGGAYSVDKFYRLRQQSMGYKHELWFEDEQPNDEIKNRVEEKIKELNYSVHGVFSHTCPFHYMPKELFLPNIDQSTIDNSTEHWLDDIEKKLNYDIWYFGHFHGNKHLDKMIMLYHEMEELK